MKSFLEELGVKSKPYIVARTQRAAVLLLKLLINNIITSISQQSRITLVNAGMLQTHMLANVLKNYASDIVFYDLTPGLSPEIKSSLIILLGLDVLGKEVYTFAKYKDLIVGGFGHKLTRNARILGLNTMIANEASSGKLLVLQSNQGVVIAKPCEHILCEYEISNIEKEAVNALREYMIEFGALGATDVINVLTARLGVTRNEAREIIMSLLDKKLLRKIGNKFLLEIPLE